jgi:hypothetical protein
MENRPVGGELFSADWRAERHDEADSRFSHSFESTYKDKISSS